MDVNGTRHHLLLGRRDFQRALDASAPGAEDIAWDEAFQGISLRRRLMPIRTVAGAPAATAARRGAGADGFGNIYFIDAPRRQILLQTGAGDVFRFWSVEELAARPASGELFAPAAAPVPAPLPLLSGLAVTTQHRLVVGTLAPAGLLLFDLHGQGPPCWWRWPDELAFAPFDLAPRPHGGVVILDRDPSTLAARLWWLDETLSPERPRGAVALSPARAPDFAPEGAPSAPGAARTFAAPETLDAAGAVQAGDAVAIAVLQDDSLLVLDAGGPGATGRVHRLRGIRHTSTTPLGAALLAPHVGEALDPLHAFAVVTAAAAVDDPAYSGQLYLASRRFQQLFVFTYRADGDRFELALEPSSVPTHAYTGKALVAAGGEVYYDGPERFHAAVAEPRVHHARRAVLAGAGLVFDGKQAGCVWHRLRLDACIPPGAEVWFSVRAADDRALLEELPWPEPVRIDYLRGDGSEIPFHRPFGARPPRARDALGGATGTAGGAHLGTYEALLQGAVGRYLKLQLTFAGDGRVSPRVRAVRVDYPRFSYLREYLPAAYREDEISGDFLERFLANVEGMFTDIEGRVARAELLFDPDAAPEEYLAWLGGWLGAMVDDGWEEWRKRLFLRNAWLLFRRRGTREALRAFLRLATDPLPRCPADALFDGLRDDARPGPAAGACSGACAGPRQAAGELRIVEAFELRHYAPEALGDVGPERPSLSRAGAPFRAEEGASALHRRYAAWLEARYRDPAGAADALARLNASWRPATPIPSFAALRFSAVSPAREEKRRDWRAFADETFAGAYPRVDHQDVGLYRESLARRYGDIDALNRAYGRAGAARYRSFAELDLPQEDDLPADGAPLSDWLRFVTGTLRIRRTAHRFTVLVPARLGESEEERMLRVARVSAIVEREKPAHTAFDTKLFWALFQVGTARLGFDTSLGDSARFLPVVLDAGYLGQGYLAAGHPMSAPRPPVIGRDSVRIDPLLDDQHGLQ